MLASRARIEGGRFSITLLLLWRLCPTKPARYDVGAPPCRGAEGVRAPGSVKEAVRRLLEQLPDDCSLEDVQYHLYVRHKIELGLAEARQGHVVDLQEVERRLARWLEK